MKIKRLYLLLTLVVLVVVTSNINWGKEKWKRALESDANGYYAYNPALFIYHDPQFKFLKTVNKEKGQERLFYDYRIRYQDSLFINKYYVGTSLLQMPFFLTAHFMASVSDDDSDGYSRVYMRAVQLAAIFYALLGLYCIFQILSHYQIDVRYQIIVATAVLFGTNAFVYTIVEAGMAHIYSFAMVSLFLSLFIRWMKAQKDQQFVSLAIVFALALLCRPTNVLILLFLPFIHRKILYDLLKVRLKTWLISIAIFLAMTSIQLWWYYAAVGEFFIDSYTYETFDFSRPEMVNFLFSYRKGLFLYTPIYLISLFGLYPIYRQRPFEAIYFFGFFILITYIFSSWWMWYYGGSFSARVFVDFLPIFSIPLAILLEKSSRRLRPFIIGLVLALVVLCQLQTYQYRYYIIHYSEMTKSMYWDHFLQLKK